MIKTNIDVKVDTMDITAQKIDKVKSSLFIWKLRSLLLLVRDQLIQSVETNIHRNPTKLEKVNIVKQRHFGFWMVSCC